MPVRGRQLTYTKNPSSPSSLKIFPMELSTPLWRREDRQGHWSLQTLPAHQPHSAPGREGTGCSSTWLWDSALAT